MVRVVEDQLPDALTRSMVRKATREDKKLSLLREDIERGVCRPALHQYTKVFEDLTVVDGMIIREGRLLVLESLRAVTIQIAHEGHLGQQKTLGLLRQMVWFPNMEGLVKEFVETCAPCQAAQPRTAQEPINPTEYPEGPWQTLHADFKGPVAGSWYLHVLIDQYSK